MKHYRYPRTLNEAFGPYTSQDFHEEQDPMPKADRIVMGVSIVLAVVLIVLILAGVIQ